MKFQIILDLDVADQSEADLTARLTAALPGIFDRPADFIEFIEVTLLDDDFNVP